MSFNVSWTKESKITFNENIEYLIQKWNQASINDFLDRIDEVVKGISENPEVYPVYRKSDQLHKCVLNKHVTLYYRVASENRIDLITFWNTHQNPSNLKV